MVNTNILKGRIYAAGYTIKSLADKMGIAYNLFSKKVCGHVGFTTQQMLQLCEILSLTNEEARDIFMPERFTEQQP